MLKDLILKNRSFRRFDGSHAIERETLRELVDLARLSASAANLQPLKYMLSCDAETNAKVFSHLAWAGYLTDWDGPAEHERPTAYILILGDTALAPKFNCDHGIAAQSILLGAAERGLGGCMIGSIKRDELRAALAIPDRLQILLVLALGKPTEHIVIEPLGENGGIEYWRNSAGVHHVPKRGLNEIIIG